MQNRQAGYQYLDGSTGGSLPTPAAGPGWALIPIDSTSLGRLIFEEKLGIERKIEREREREKLIRFFLGFQNGVYSR